MPLPPPENNLVGTEGGESLGDAAGTSKSSAPAILPGVSWIS
jgi:hypothetical protein